MRYFNLPQRFVDTFTPNWGIMSIHQRNDPANLSYRLLIISNGRNRSELDLITHMLPSEGERHPNFKIFEFMNYSDYNEIPMMKFCTQWNELTLTLLPWHQSQYRELIWGDFTPFHGGLQYMLLYYYINPAHLSERPGQDVARYDEDKHDAMEFNISAYGQSMDTQIYIDNGVIPPHPLGSR